MKKSIIIFIIAGLIIIAGLGIYYLLKPAEFAKPPAIAERSGEPVAANQVGLQADIIKQAVQSGDLNKCSEVADKSLAADCSAQASFSLAIQKKDKKYCENIINKTDKENCFKVLADMGVK
ncbi:MAG: hypothetical protein AUJ11_02065 [Parcubacteria group bacterium CG1_02_44_65]|nr:MAG: hypothetical protein AUJ11_02065 [Parcubacteria group bacterium CG1_02_44_65]